MKLELGFVRIQGLRQLAALIMVATAWSAPAADLDPADLDKRVGQPADIAPSAYHYRADRPADQNPPETAFLFETAIGHKRQGVLCGLLWEEPRPVNRIELIWPKAAKAVPRVDEIVVKWMPHGNSSSWWSRREAKSDKKPDRLTAEKPEETAEGRILAYTVDATRPANAMDNLVVAMKGDDPSADSWAMPIVRVFTPQTWKKTILEIEWGFQSGTAQKQFNGRIEAYNGVIGKVSALAGDEGLNLTGEAAWQSKPGGGGRRGITVSVLYLGNTYNTPVWPHQAGLEDANRTLITVWTQSGSFTFLPADLESGPMLAPEYGFFVTQAGHDVSAARFQKELSAKRFKTIRQRTREHAEQSWDGAMKALFGERTFPPYPQPEFEPASTIDVPERRLVEAWRVGAWHLLRECKKDAQGRYIIQDFPYPALAHETYLIIRMLDQMGMHEAARQGLARWLDRDETKPINIDGQFHDSIGIMSGVEWDWQHLGGPGLIQWQMVEHYRLTGDQEWLKEAAPKLQANADWMIRQRRAFMKEVPGRDRAWCRGLLPPHNIWDSTNWRLWYESNVNYYFGLKHYAQAIADLDPQASRKYLAEAEAFARDILAAADRSFVLSPVIRVRDGTYRSFLPPTPYMRGPASRHMPTSFGSPEHTPGLYADIIRGSVHIINLAQLLPASDPRAQGMIDVLEDRLLLEHHRLPMRTPGYDPEKHWFGGAGWYYQCGIERTPNVHLQWDDVPNFLRSFYNDYAVNIVIGPYTFNEHTTRGPSDKSFEEAAFLERLRSMLLMEEGDQLWLARATPRAWLEPGKKIAVKHAPTHFGTVSYEIVSDLDHGQINATVEMPSRQPPKVVLLRLRHPQAAPIRSVSVDGKPWAEIDKEKEVIRLEGLKGTVSLSVKY